VSATTYQDLLRTATDLIGRKELALSLKVPAVLLDAWLAGHGTMPDDTLRVLLNLMARLEKP
jgi:hypothetical protein